LEPSPLIHTINQPDEKNNNDISAPFGLYSCKWKEIISFNYPLNSPQTDETLNFSTMNQTKHEFQRSAGTEISFKQKEGFIANLTYTYTNSQSTTISTTSSNSIKINIPAGGKKSNNVNYLFLRVRVPYLKSELSEKSGSTERPKFIPQWCWDNNEEFYLLLPYFDPDSNAQL
jgi:hypothetical protein